MKRSVAQKIVDKYTFKILTLLDLYDTDITINLVDIPTEEQTRTYGEGLNGLCDALPEYCVATISIFYKNEHSEQEFIKTLLHEICHVFLNSYHKYVACVNVTFDEASIIPNILNESFRQADEISVTKLSNVLYKIIVDKDK